MEVDEVSKKLGSINEKLENIETRVDYACDKVDSLDERLPDDDLDEITDKVDAHSRYWWYLSSGVSTFIAFLGFLLTLTWNQIIRLFK